MFTQWQVRMQTNYDMYLRYAKKQIDQMYHVVYERELNKSFDTHIVRCEGYETLTSFQRNTYNMNQHGKMCTEQAEWLKKLQDCGSNQKDEVVNEELDTRLRVSLMKQKSNCASKDGPPKMDDIKDVQISSYDRYQKMEIICESSEGLESGVTVLEVAMDPSFVDLDVIGHVTSPLLDNDTMIYKGIKTNTFLEGGMTDDQKDEAIRGVTTCGGPCFSLKGVHHVVVTNREMLSVLETNRGEEVAHRLGFNANRRLPWLSQVAQNFKFYRLRGLMIDYVPNPEKQFVFLLELSSFIPKPGRTDIRLEPTYYRCDGTKSFNYLIECEQRCDDHLLVEKSGMQDVPGILVTRIATDYPFQAVVGELWISYEYEFWGKANLPHIHDPIETQIRLVGRMMGPDANVVRYLTSRCESGHKSKITYRWIDSEGNQSKNYGRDSLELSIRAKYDKIDKIVVSREYQGNLLRPYEFPVMIVARICACWTFLGGELREVNLELNGIWKNFWAKYSRLDMLYQTRQREYIAELTEVGLVPTRYNRYPSHLKLSDFRAQRDNNFGVQKDSGWKDPD